MKNKTWIYIVGAIAISFYFLSRVGKNMSKEYLQWRFDAKGEPPQKTSSLLNSLNDVDLLIVYRYFHDFIDLGTKPHPESDIQKAFDVVNRKYNII